MGRDRTAFGTDAARYTQDFSTNTINCYLKAQQQVHRPELICVCHGPCVLQAVLTGKGPYQNLVDHLSDPIHNNILGNFLPH